MKVTQTQTKIYLIKMVDGTNTLKQNIELFYVRRNRGEWVKLSIESKDGKDSTIFSLGSPSATPAGQQVHRDARVFIFTLSE